MKKQIFFTIILAISVAAVYAQPSQGDIQIIQKYFGTEKAAMLREYMALTPQQDSAFWPTYNKYENERLAMGSQRFALIDDYLKNVQNITEEKAIELVDKGLTLEVKYRYLLKRYFSELSKKIGPVKAAQWYQFENYLNNVINLSVQENIPFIGDLEQKHAGELKKGVKK